ncbi:MAG: shikimate dehydrogenase [Clostridia bacterium]|nr:shikimate dehydrogenase [Clostridia bacterium]
MSEASSRKLKYCVIGKSLPHTLSPEIHMAFGREVYDVCEFADTDELAAFVNGREYAGYNVTIPYKRDVIPMLDEVSEEAAAIGAVNTVVTEGDRLVGYNTDVEGMRYALRAAEIDLYGKNVLILGSGGTCQTAKYVCHTGGAVSVNVVSRSGIINYDNCYELTDVQVVINTTPVGMMPHAYEVPIDLDRFERLEGVFDCVYNPLETLLVKTARKLGVKAANGLLMLVEQARLAHNLYQRAVGLPECDESMTVSVAAKVERERRNVVLVGMAGSGKSVIGKRLAKAMGREFVDTDCEIEKSEGVSIPDIFGENGEAYFRAAESRAVEGACTRLGLVIATGGGAVLDERNRFFMKANGVCVLIYRNPEELATKGRPLSSDIEKAKRLYEQRKPIYEAVADITVFNNSDLDSAIQKVLSKIGE